MPSTDKSQPVTKTTSLYGSSGNTSSQLIVTKNSHKVWQLARAQWQSLHTILFQSKLTQLDVDLRVCRLLKKERKKKKRSQRGKKEKRKKKKEKRKKKRKRTENRRRTSVMVLRSQSSYVSPGTTRRPSSLSTSPCSVIGTHRP